MSLTRGGCEYSVAFIQNHGGRLWGGLKSSSERMDDDEGQGCRNRIDRWCKDDTSGDDVDGGWMECRGSLVA